MNILNSYIKILSIGFFHSLNTLFGKIRFKLGMMILPKDISNFYELILIKIGKDIDDLDPRQRNKLVSFSIDMNFK
jgi:hypothetical protein